MRRDPVCWEILDAKRRSMLRNLKFLRTDYRFYLAGGTALALQIRHRKSIDFDFYTARAFDPARLHGRLKKIFKQITPLHLAEGTLIVSIQGIDMSFFRYEYPLLKPLISTPYLDLLSLEDIAAMKMIALVQRGTRRDFVDLYYLLRRFRLESLLRWAKRKYALFNPYMGLRALTYFQDAEQDKSRRRLATLEAIAWPRIKREITDAVDRYRKTHLPSR